MCRGFLSPFHQDCLTVMWSAAPLRTDLLLICNALRGNKLIEYNYKSNSKCLINYVDVSTKSVIKKKHIFFLIVSFKSFFANNLIMAYRIGMVFKLQ